VVKSDKSREVYLLEFVQTIQSKFRSWRKLFSVLQVVYRSHSCLSSVLWLSAIQN